MKGFLHLRSFIRSLAYRVGADQLLPSATSNLDAQQWDSKLSGEWQAYLDDTISIATRDTLIGLLITRRTKDAAVLDLACASGSLNQRLGAQLGSYVGVDISKVAIEQARKRNPGAVFHVSTIEDFEPDQTFDAIVCSEVLYYLNVSAAVKQVLRYSEYLKDRGMIIVSMKDDPKSKRIFRELRRHLSWHYGILVQAKPEMPEYIVDKNTARPAFLVGVFEKPAHDGSSFAQ